MNTRMHAPVVSAPLTGSMLLLEQGKARHQKLAQRLTKVQVEVETATRQLRDAQEEAQREFGTSDLNSLRALYEQREADNARMVAEFVAQLDSLEQALSDVERQLASS